MTTRELRLSPGGGLLRISVLTKRWVNRDSLALRFVPEPPDRCEDLREGVQAARVNCPTLGGLGLLAVSETKTPATRRAAR